MGKVEFGKGDVNGEVGEDGSAQVRIQSDFWLTS